jgi:uncharacterized hydrophobic protein (TIGR00271 family)
MPVAVVITHPEEAHAALHWAVEFCPPGESVIVFAPVAIRGKVVHEPMPLPELTAAESPLLGRLRDAVAAIQAYPQPTPVDPSSGVVHTLEVAAASARSERAGTSSERVLLCEVDRHTAVKEILETAARYKVSLLIVPRSVELGRNDPEDVARVLFTHAPCTTVLLRPGPQVPAPSRQILVATSGGVHSCEALRLATAIAERNQGRVTALYVEPPIDAVAGEVGRRELSRIIGSCVASNKRIVPKVVVGKHILSAVAEEAHEDYDLLLIGSSNHGFLRRALFGTIPQKLLKQGAGPTVAVLRKALPLSRRMRTALRQKVERWVPQLDREMRVRFVESLQSSSRLGFDFVALICLSTVIAALGLIRNSGAVVIGAMLVAPLMTPLVASGLSLVQGNWHLIRIASRTVFGGFLLAFAIGIVLGWVVPGLTPTDEMLSRGSPSAFDLLVALVSGMAAAYAGSRPHLISALPGVAIAASLIPPVATSGMALAIGEWSLSSGALLLFLTNIVAIVLGTAASLWAVGVRGGSAERGPRRWAIGVSLALILSALGLAWYESTPHLRMPPEMLPAVRQTIAGYEDVELLAAQASWSKRSESLLHLTVAAPGPLPPALTRELEQLAAQHRVDCTVDIRVRQQISAAPAAASTGE